MYNLAKFRNRLKETLKEKFNVDGKWYRNSDVKSEERYAYRERCPMGTRDVVVANITMNDNTRLKVRHYV